MKLYGLIGHPLGHSFSKAYFEKKFKDECLNCDFVNFDIDNLGKLKDIVTLYTDLQGFTITHPYKHDIIKHLDFIDESANEIGAVNVVKIGTDRKLFGYNTDHIGFQRLLDDVISDKKISKAIICGTGGASKSVKHVLKNNHIDYQLVSRNPSSKECISYFQLKADGFHDNELIINTTPLGMYPSVNECIDIPYDTINSSNILVDLIYNPEETLFLSKGKSRGAHTHNGLKMLHMQADAAWSIWSKE